jgi:hypothetical protein
VGYRGFSPGARGESSLGRIPCDCAGSTSGCLVLEGRAVTSDDEGCFMNGNRVYYAWLYEDADRDDDTDLPTYVRPELP